MKEAKIMKCGFCNKEIKNYKEIVKYRKGTGNKTVMCCPHCNAILGIYNY